MATGERPSLLGQELVIQVEARLEDHLQHPGSGHTKRCPSRSQGVYICQGGGAPRLLTLFYRIAEQRNGSLVVSLQCP